MTPDISAVATADKKTEDHGGNDRTQQEPRADGQQDGRVHHNQVMRRGSEHA